MSDARAAKLDFNPGILQIEVPAGATAGAKVPVDLDKGRKGILVVPEGAAAGATLDCRPVEQWEEKIIEVEKKDQTVRLGITMASDGAESPWVSEDIAEEGAAHGKLERGDQITHVVCTSAKSSVNQDAKGCEATSTIFKEAIGKIMISVRRPVPCAVSLVQMKGFLSKRSPKSFAGIHAWQQRWFELTPTKMTYYEVQTRGEDADGVAVVAVEKGCIPLCELAGVRAVASGKGKARLDLLRSDSRIFQMMAPSPPERELWVKAINGAIISNLTAAAAGAAVSQPKAAAEAAPAEVEAVADEAPAKPDGGADGGADSGADEMEAVADDGGAEEPAADEESVEPVPARLSLGPVMTDGKEEPQFWRM